MPVSLSDALRVLRAQGHIEVSIAVGACLDGDVECVSAASALLWSAGQGFDIHADHVILATNAFTSQLFPELSAIRARQSQVQVTEFAPDRASSLSGLSGFAGKSTSDGPTGTTVAVL